MLLLHKVTDEVLSEGVIHLMPTPVQNPTLKAAVDFAVGDISSENFQSFLKIYHLPTQKQSSFY